MKTPTRNQPLPAPYARLLALIGLLSLLLPVRAAAAVIFLSDFTITDTNYDGQDIVALGCAVSVNGTHAFNSVLVSNNASFNIAGGTTQTVAGGLLVVSNSMVICQGANLTGQIGNQWAGVGPTIIAGGVAVDASSTISADGQGYAGGPVNIIGSGPGAGQGACRAGGGGYGGAGGDGAGGAGGPAYGSGVTPTDLGSGGGGDFCFTAPGGAGGGAIQLIVAGTLQLDGQISANGVDAGGGAGGGAGGSIYLTVNSLSGGGTFSANGGTGGPQVGGGGGGGRIAVLYTNASAYTGYANCTANGGTGGGGPGRGSSGLAGTVAFFDGATTPLGLVLDGVESTLTIAAGTTATYRSILVTNGASLVVAGGAAVNISGLLVVASNSTVLCESLNNASTNATGQWAGQGATITAGDVFVDASSAITADGQGYAGGPASVTGSGPGGGVGTCRAGGAGYGGAGGDGAGGAGGLAYGSELTPTDLGSGGGGDFCFDAPGGAGGGAIRLIVAGTLQLDGRVSANGIPADGGAGGGAGGSIYVTVNTLSGGGGFYANGAPGGPQVGGGGAGGRVAVYTWWSSLLPLANLVAAGAGGGAPGSALLSSTPFGSGLANGSFSFELLATSGQSYSIFTNSNLRIANWGLYTNFTGSGTVVPIVAPPTSPDQLFFRVREP